MEMICKAKHTENEEFYCIAKDEKGIKYALLDDEMEDDDLTLPKVAYDVYLEDDDRVKGKYKHFKGNMYEVLGIAYDKDGDKYIFYKALYENEVKFWLRPYDMFFSPVDKEKYPEVKQELRFSKVVK